jgi:glycosyltransferase involved in cell wall biosynthesis
LIVGGIRAGEDKKQLDDLYSSIPNPNINMTGYVSNQDLPSYYSVMDVFVHPSLRDGLPHQLAEL